VLSVRLEIAMSSALPMALPRQNNCAAVAAPAPAAPVAMGPHGLPIPPAATTDQPGGSPANLTILDWAGLRSAVSWTFDDAQPSQIGHYYEIALDAKELTLSP
jgi:hypothetical protein